MEKLAKGRSTGVDSTFECTASDPAPLARVVPMSLLDELVSCFALFFVPGAALWMPVVAIALAAAAPWVGWVPLLTLISVLAGLSLLLPRGQSPSVIHSAVARKIMQYFSYRVVWAHKLEHHEQHVLAAHPHGAFPIGNMLTLVSTPDAGGFYFLGLAASAALYVPIMGQALSWIGCVHASKRTALEVMGKGHSVGLSPGMCEPPLPHPTTMHTRAQLHASPRYRPPPRAAPCAGGIAEMFCCTDTTNETVYLNKRKVRPPRVPP